MALIEKIGCYLGLLLGGGLNQREGCILERGVHIRERCNQEERSKLGDRVLVGQRG